MKTPLDKQRIDKWLWAARFYKTRALAVTQIGRGRVRMGNMPVKPAREVRAGDVIALMQGHVRREVVVKALSATRGPAPVAQQLYEETASSVAERERQTTLRRLAPEPAQFMGKGRPTKRERRALDKQRAGHWDERWSASWDEPS